jgi:3-methyl-2-oxobutanoate hydroxymethyltransferase
VVADMPFMSYQASESEAMHNAGRFLKDAGAGAVKIEGGAFRAPLVRALVRNGIPVLGHIGFTPQSIRQAGGYRVEGRTEDAAAKLLEDAGELDDAGVFALVLECVPPDVARQVTAAVRVPTIGIGAGAACDGQILVCHDLLGLLTDFKPRFAKRYAELGRDMAAAFAAYRDEVERGAFPDAEHSY